MTAEDSLKVIIERAKKDEDILAVVVYGSYARHEDYNDIDVSLALCKSKVGKINSLKKEIEYSEPGLDVHIFQDLPLYIQARVLEEGIIYHVKNEDEYYDLVFYTLRVWGDFRPRFEMILEGVLHGSESSSEVG